MPVLTGAFGEIVMAKQGGDTATAAAAAEIALLFAERGITDASVSSRVAVIIGKHCSRDSLDQAYEEVKVFHAAFNVPAGRRPRRLDGNEKRRRIGWMLEEIDELEKAETREGQSDAVIDLIYFGIGYLVEMGVPPAGIWRAVHRANLAKLWDGKVRVDADGKVMKPEGWIAPEAEIARIIADLDKRSRERDGPGLE